MPSLSVATDSADLHLNNSEAAARRGPVPTPRGGVGYFAGLSLYVKSGHPKFTSNCFGSKYTTLEASRPCRRARLFCAMNAPMTAAAWARRRGEAPRQ